MMKHLARVAAVLSMFLFAGTAARADTISVSGTVTDMNSISMPFTVQVRAWTYVEDETLANGEVYTGYLVKSGHSTFVNGSGWYQLDLPPGTYKLDTRVGVSSGSAYPAYDGTTSTARYWLEERWHEASVGSEQNWVQEDATLLVLNPGSADLTEVNFRMGLAGAVAGRVQGYTRTATSWRVWLTGVDVRMEQVSDPRRHHNSITRGNPAGRVGFFNGRFESRGLRPALAHRLLVYDRDGYNRTYVHGSTHTPSAGNRHWFGTISLAAMDADPYPLNRDIDSALDIGRWNFDQNPPPVWSTGTAAMARIAPRNRGVVNWFCWSVRPEDRFLVTATTLDTIPELPGRYHPWVDPYLKLVRMGQDGDSHVLVPGTQPDRYSGPGPLDARVDTGRVQENATYCAAVTMAGDEDFEGQGQWRSGHYVLNIEMGNRPPKVDVYHGPTENPAHVAISEGETIVLDVVYSDPDGDSVDAAHSFRRGLNPVPGSTFVAGATSGTFTWTSPLDGAGSYTATFTVSDDEFSTSRSVVINVGAVNYPPTTPVLVSPGNGQTVTTRTPTLVFENSEDPDGPDSELSYDVAIFYSEPDQSTLPAQMITGLPHGVGGTVTTTPQEQLPEKSDVWWRARADDGADENRYSDWSETRRFFVHSIPPEIEAYVRGDPAPEVIERHEGDHLVIDLEYRAPYGPVPNLAFTLLDVDGEPVEPSPELDIEDQMITDEGEATFSWTIGPLDSAGSPYALRFTAADNLYSTHLDLEIDVLPRNLPPTAPSILEPEDGEGVSSRLPVIVAENAVDPEEEDLFLHFEVASDLDFDTIVAASLPEGVPQNEADVATSWQVDVALEWNQTYFVRARAIDVHGLAGPYSEPHSFYVLPRTAPSIVEPETDEVVPTREPLIVAENSHDPDGASLFMFIEVASDAAFGNVVAQTPAPGVPQDEGGLTSWQVSPQLTFGDVFYVRATGVDVEGLAGPSSETVIFAVRDNSPPTESVLAGPFEAQCSGGVFTESPLEVPVVHGVDPDGDPVFIHLQIYPHGADPDEGVLLDELSPAESEGDITVMYLDIAALPDNTRYTIRVRSYDGIDYSSWQTCDFWSNVRNSPPSQLSILMPEPGTELPLNTTEVTVVVRNAEDPDSVVPGTSIDVAWCSSLDENFGDCSGDVTEWQSVPQSSLDPNDTTEFVVEGLTNREAWHVKACARDETGLCGPSDTTWVVVGNEDDVTVAPGGCCSTAPGGHPWLAMLALLSLALLAPRRTRRAA